MTAILHAVIPRAYKRREERACNSTIIEEKGIGNGMKSMYVRAQKQSVFQSLSTPGKFPGKLIEPNHS